MDLLTSHRNYEWLHNLGTGDEKWLLYINYASKRQWLSVDQADTVTLKNDLHPKKVTSSIKGIIYWELLPDGCIVTADLYCQQLNRIAQKVKSKQDRVYFLHDNAKLHVAKSIRETLLELPFLIHFTLQAWLLLTITCFYLSLIICVRKISMTKIISKRTFQPKVSGLLRTRHFFSTRPLATGCS